MFGCLDRKDLKKYNAYTMAEMLLVMAIIAVVMLSLPKATKKMFRMESVRSNHARYECYWENNVLKQYTVTETLGGGAVKDGPVVASTRSGYDDVCVFNPPDNTPYIILHAVGGGGGGVEVYDTLQGKETNTALAYFNKEETDLWPDWFSSSGVQNFAFTTSNSAADNYHKKVKDIKYYEADSIYNSQSVRYRPSGSAGTLKSLFFPNLPAGARLIMMPGKGGAVGSARSQTVSLSGGAGARTVVRLLYSGADLASCKSKTKTTDNDCNNGCCDLIVAEGGKGGDTLTHDGARIDSKQSVMLTGGQPRDYDISNYSSVMEKQSGFSMVLANDSDVEDLQTHVDSRAGNGGNGGNQYVTDTAGDIIYELNDYDGIIGGGMVYGTKWKTLSQEVSPNIYANSHCTHGSVSGTVWAKRRGYCIPAFSVCFIGNIKLTPGTIPGMACNDATKCASFELDFSGSTPNVIPKSGATGNYRYCQYDTTNQGISCEEKVTSGTTHHCTATAVGSQGHKCASGATPENNKVCKARAGGDGAVVILW